LKSTTVGSDQIAAFRPLIAEVYEAAASGDPNYFAHFHLSSNPDVWVEVAVDTVNFCYPMAADPILLLAERNVPPLDELSLESWQPNVHACVQHRDEDLRAIAKFVDALFCHILGAGTDYPVDVSIERFANS
jgi:hypothetical protein